MTLTLSVKLLNILILSLEIIILDYSNIHHDLLKFYFSNHIIFYWNSLPNSVVYSNFCAIYEKKLVFLFRSIKNVHISESDLYGSGSQSKLKEC